MYDQGILTMSATPDPTPSRRSGSRLFWGRGPAGHWQLRPKTAPCAAPRAPVGSGSAFGFIPEPLPHLKVQCLQDDSRRAAAQPPASMQEGDWTLRIGTRAG